MRKQQKLKLLNNKILNRSNKKWSLFVINVFFGICSATLFFIALDKIKKNQIEGLEEILMLSLGMLLNGDGLNILPGFQKESVYSQDKIELFQVSKRSFFYNLFYSHFYSSRVILYLLPVIVILYFLLLSSVIQSLIFLICWFVLFLFSTTIISFSNGILNILYCKYGDKLQKVFMILILLFIVLSSFLSQYIDKVELPLSWLINNFISMVN